MALRPYVVLQDGEVGTGKAGGEEDAQSRHASAIEAQVSDGQGQGKKEAQAAARRGQIWNTTEKRARGEGIALASLHIIYVLQTAYN